MAIVSSTISIMFCFQVAVSALLGDTPKLVEYGTALMSNLATKEVSTHIIMGWL